ncbi:RlpA-like double-psi beta-barrel-protein domain-containing protein-containing protein [Russula compacta]|nr:RlpA-like double-psi beta-barrel-protein domain-containing protein-containing protein [Russula compacta]
MKYTLAALVLVSSSTLSAARNSGWVQNPKGNASFTSYPICPEPSCGIGGVSGYTAQVNELAFGASNAAGDACGRCFKITPTGDPYAPTNSGPYGNTIVVRVTDRCPIPAPATARPWCNQTVSNPLNQVNVSMHFNLCEESGASGAFFNGTSPELIGTYEEVLCPDDSKEGPALWNGGCMAPGNAPFWPKQSCGNKGTPPQ